MAATAMSTYQVVLLATAITPAGVVAVQTGVTAATVTAATVTAATVTTQATAATMGVTNTHITTRP